MGKASKVVENASEDGSKYHFISLFLARFRAIKICNHNRLRIIENWTLMQRMKENDVMMVRKVSLNYSLMTETYTFSFKSIGNDDLYVTGGQPGPPSNITAKFFGHPLPLLQAG